MNEPKANFLDRVEYSFMLLKSNFLNISLYYLIMTVISSSLMYISWLLLSQIGLSFFWDNKDLWANTALYIQLAYFGMIYFIVILSILIIKIPFNLSLIKNINSHFKGENFNSLDNLKYWIKNLSNIFRVYRYLFKYVYLLPSLLLIIGLLVFIMERKIGWIIIVLSIFLWMYFWIYRWLKSAFSINYTICSDNYSEENFKKALSLTENNLMRIFWNLLWIWVLIYLVSNITSLVLSIFSIWTSWDISSIVSNINNIGRENLTQEKISAVLEQLKPTTTSTIFWFIKNVLSSGIIWVFFVFSAIFDVVFMKRLWIEKNIKDENDTLIEVIQ